MVRMQLIYEGQLSVRAIHEPSSTEIRTDAPKDNNGLGRSFSPTDLVGTALGSCILTVMAIVAERHGIAMTGARASVTKEMVAVPLRRIGRLEVRLDMPAGLSAESRTLLERAALACPVKQSLHPDVVIDLQWNWGD